MVKNAKVQVMGAVRAGDLPLKIDCSIDSSHVVDVQTASRFRWTAPLLYWERASPKERVE